MPCQERTQWAKEEANTNRGQRQHHAEFRTDWLKHQRGKDHACCLSVDKEVVVLDCGSGTRRKSNATILRLSISGHETQIGRASCRGRRESASAGGAWAADAE